MNLELVIMVIDLCNTWEMFTKFSDIYSSDKMCFNTELSSSSVFDIGKGIIELDHAISNDDDSTHEVREF
jgi:hypothetical protein